MPAFAASADQPAHVTSVVRADQKSGHLVRSVVVEPRPVFARTVATDAEPVSQARDFASDVAAMVERIALEEGVEESLVHSVIRAESNYNPNAVSPKGALGIMQLIPATARRFGVGNVFDARENIQGGVKYLKFLLDYYRGDYAKTIAAYNAGEAAVDKYNGVPPYPETRNYVYRVAMNLKAARQQRAVVARSAPPDSGRTAVAATVVETYNQPPTSLGSDGRIYYRTP
jgi:hypothetical protein